MTRSDSNVQTARVNPGDGAAAGQMLLPAFADPVFDAQSTFRVIMTAMANPGRILDLPDLLPAFTAGERGVAAALLTLADFETPLWLPPHLRDSALGRAIRFHTGAPMVEPRAATFAVLSGEGEEPPLEAFSIGDDRYPDRSATILRVCESLTAPGDVRLSGPGIPGSRTLRVTGPGIDGGFWRALAANHALYPVGVDVLLVCGLRVVGLPRSCRVDMIGEQG
jgi:alpha-D-ribose 1-methylphosphonate 5-triphosphate synthase subunit PhnH